MKIGNSEFENFEELDDELKKLLIDIFSKTDQPALYDWNGYFGIPTGLVPDTRPAAEKLLSIISYINMIDEDPLHQKIEDHIHNLWINTYPDYKERCGHMTWYEARIPYIDPNVKKLVKQIEESPDKYKELMAEMDKSKYRYLAMQDTENAEALKKASAFEYIVYTVLIRKDLKSRFITDEATGKITGFVPCKEDGKESTTVNL
jgi:hypothetical protein